MKLRVRLASLSFLRIPSPFRALLIFLALPLALSSAFARPPAAAAPGPDAPIELHEGWMLQSSCDVQADGAQISAAGFSTSAWHSTTVPSTIVAALVADKTYPDPYFGTNLRSLPGGDHPKGKNFSRLDMPKDSPFRCSWWYRTEFRLPPDYAGRRVWIDFGGINYRANIWLNGRKVASDQDVAGAYRTYEFEITEFVDHKGPNALAVETFAQTPDDLGVNWVDWNPAPPDKNMGLWRGVFLRSSGPVAVRYPFVSTHFPEPGSLEEADLTVEAQLKNASQSAVSGTLEGAIEDIHFQQALVLQPGETRKVRFSPDQFPVLRVRDPKLWWPYVMGPQNLHQVTLRFVEGDRTDDVASARFGIREITAALDENQHLLFRVNGRKILIRGGGWAPDMLLREDDQKMAQQFRYVRDLNLNTLRLEGKMESDEFFRLADEQGILVMAGWCCCDHWEEWKKWKPRDLEIATDSVTSQILRLRSHPSLLAWLNGSDNPPPPNVEESYIQALKNASWPNPYISSASQKISHLTGVSGVKMTGPYDYVPPDYWLSDVWQFGGAFGFNTETGPGPSVPPLDSLKKFLPDADIHPGDPVWEFHAGLEGFQNLKHFDGAMDDIYGKPADFRDYEIKAQAMAYDSERAMFEAYSRNKYTSTGVIQWMLNNAWPSLIWHLYDYYLEPAGAYFGVKKACEPLHVQYSYDDGSIVVVNSRYAKYDGMNVSAELYDVNLKPLFSRQAAVGVGPDQVQKAFTIPAAAFVKSSPVYFLKLDLRDAGGSDISSNFYWLSEKHNVYDWAGTDYKFTPVSSYENLKALNSLPQASVQAAASIRFGPANSEVVVTLKNSSAHLAFRVRAAVRQAATHGDILPVEWSDNYVDLMPGETRNLVATIGSAQARQGPLELAVDAWNVPPAVVNVSSGSAQAAPDRNQTRGGGR
ncbi:MAG TPA: glycosyl hydrolase family 2 [Verrucomicrobiae bacterium]|nr:glycosyl hydrolase family 2 [Verrucomicrobiae bacterium]